MNIHQFGHSSNGDQDEKIGNNTNKPSVIFKKNPNRQEADRLAMIVQQRRGTLNNREQIQ